MKTKLLHRLRQRAKREIGITAKVQYKEFVNYIVGWRGRKPRHEFDLKLPFDDYNKAIEQLYASRRWRILRLVGRIRARRDVRKLNKQFRTL